MSKSKDMVDGLRDIADNAAILFEEKFDVTESKKWLMDNWRYSVAIAAIYLVLVYSGRKFMEDKKRWQLTPLLFLWNGALAIFSVVGVVRFVSVIVLVFRQHGFVSAICDLEPELHEGNVVLAFWGFAFAASKIVELGDTAFIVLRKQPLTFLHCYHHCTVLIYTWFSYSNLSSSGLLFGGVNVAVHSAMYTYFALKTVKVRIPRAVSMAITASQILQMVVGCLINYTAYRVLSKGEYCNVTYDNIKYSLMMYSSYLILFAHFFWRSYITGTPVSEYYRNSRAKKAE